jgi:hypothetical protein
MTLLILSIIDKVLAIALETVKGMPEESRKAFWERHDARMQFWQDLFQRESDKA